MKTYTLNEIMMFANFACQSPLHAQLLFWAFVMQGNSRYAAFVQVAHHNSLPRAQVIDIKTRRVA